MEPADAATLKAQANALKDQGNALYAARKFAKAYELYTRAIALAPDAVFYSNRSGCALDLGRVHDAEADARACLELNPAWPKAAYRLGASLEAQSRLEEAQRAYDAGLVLDAAHVDLLAGRERVTQRLEAVRAAADARPSFMDCVLYSTQLVDPAVAGAAGVGPELHELAAAFPRVRLEGTPGDGECGRRLVAAEDLPALSEVFTEVAAFWVGPLTNRFGALLPRVVELPPQPDGGDTATAIAAVEHLLLQLEPFSLAAADGEPLPPLTRAELFQRAVRLNGVGAVFDENVVEGEGEKLIGVISPVVAMINHDCGGNALVNAMWDAARSAVVVRVSTLRDIKAGEELTISYVPRKFPRVQRRGILRARYGFSCDCARCTAPYDDVVVFACPACDSGRVFAGAAACADCGAAVGEAAALTADGALVTAAKTWCAAEPGLVELATARHHAAAGAPPPPPVGCPLHATDVGRIDLAMARLSEAWNLGRRDALAVAEALVAAVDAQPCASYMSLFRVPLAHVLALHGEAARASAVYRAAAARTEAEYGADHAHTALLRALAERPPTSKADIIRAEARRRAAAAWVTCAALPEATLRRWLSPVVPRGPARRDAEGAMSMHPEDSRAIRVLGILTQRIHESRYTPGSDVLAVEAVATSAPSAAELAAAAAAPDIAARTREEE